MDYKYHLKNLEKTQNLPRKEIEKLQEKKLKRLLENSYTNVSYYSKLFKKHNLKPDDIKGFRDLPKVPLLKREAIKNKFNDLISKNIKNNKIINDFTSGTTTGERLKIIKTKDTYHRGIAAELRAYKWYNINPAREKFYYLTGADYNIELDKKLSMKLFYLLSKTIKLNPLEMNTKKLDWFLKKMIMKNRRVLYGSPSALCSLARHIEEKGLDVNIEIVISTDNVLLKSQRKFIQNFFDCQVYDIYGTSEVRGVAFECEDHTGYHLTSENVILEIVDKNGEHVAPGERGFVLLTDLSNYAMPFIRYENGDIGILSDEVCSCGKGLHLIKPIDGQLVLRNEHFIYSVNNEKKFLPVFSFLLDDFTKIRQFQIIQKNNKCIVLKIIKGADYSKRYESYILSKIVDILDNVEVEFDYVDNIELNRNGEHNFFLRETS